MHGLCVLVGVCAVCQPACMLYEKDRLCLSCGVVYLSSAVLLFSTIYALSLWSFPFQNATCFLTLYAGCAAASEPPVLNEAAAEDVPGKQDTAPSAEGGEL